MSNKPKLSDFLAIDRNMLPVGSDERKRFDRLVEMAQELEASGTPKPTGEFGEAPSGGPYMIKPEGPEITENEVLQLLKDGNRPIVVSVPQPTVSSPSVIEAGNAMRDWIAATIWGEPYDGHGPISALKHWNTAISSLKEQGE